MQNIFSSIPTELPKELLETILTSPNVRIQRIVSRGHQTPADEWYDQEEAEWVILLSGCAKLSFEDGSVLEMKAGDYHFIPAHVRHRVHWTSPTEPSVWLCIYIKED